MDVLDQIRTEQAQRFAANMDLWMLLGLKWGRPWYEVPDILRERSVAVPRAVYARLEPWGA